MKCDSCQTPVPDGASFCPGCGGAIERELIPGVVLQERYSIRAPLVQGKSDVFLADHLGLEKSVVVKVFDQGQDEVLQSLQTEARTISALDTPAVCQLYDVGHLADGRPYVVREFMQGLTLRDAAGEGPVPLAKTVGFVERLCDAVSEIHAVGYLHGDLRAENIFLLRDGGIKLFNFHATQALSKDPTEATFQRKAEVRQLGLLACFMMAGHWPLLRPQGKRVVLNLEEPSLENVTRWLRSYVENCPSGVDESIYRALVGGQIGFTTAAQFRDAWLKGMANLREDEATLSGKWYAEGETMAEFAKTGGFLASERASTDMPIPKRKRRLAPLFVVVLLGVGGYVAVERGYAASLLNWFQGVSPQLAEPVDESAGPGTIRRWSESVAEPVPPGGRPTRNVVAPTAEHIVAERWIREGDNWLVGNPIKARRAYLRATEVAPTHPGAWTALGRWSLAQGDALMAAHFAGKALDYAPSGHKGAQELRTRAQRMLGNR